MGDSMLGSGGAAFKLLVALAALVGVAIQIQVSADPLGKLNLLSYFTIQSNIIVGVVFLASAVKTLGGGEPGRALAALERSARVWIWMTGLAFHFLLSRVWHPVGIQALANFLVHYAVPAGALLSWIVFERKGGHRIGDIVVIAAYPLLYAAASLLRGSLDGWYPYWFLDPGRAAPDGAGSFAGALAWSGGLGVGFVLLGLATTGTDALLARAGKRRIQAR